MEYHSISESNVKVEELYDDGGETESVQIFLFHDQNPLPPPPSSQSVQPTPTSLTFEYPDDLERLIEVITEVLGSLASQINRVLGPVIVNSLWKNLSVQLEAGEPDLKLASLRCATAFLNEEAGFVRSFKLSLYFVDALFSLVRFMADNVRPFPEGKGSQLEMAIDLCLEALMFYLEKSVEKAWQSAVIGQFAGEVAYLWRDILSNSDLKKLTQFSGKSRLPVTNAKYQRFIYLTLVCRGASAQPVQVLGVLLPTRKSGRVEPRFDRSAP